MKIKLRNLPILIILAITLLIVIGCTWQELHVDQKAKTAILTLTSTIAGIRERENPIPIRTASMPPPLQHLVATITLTVTPTPKLMLTRTPMPTLSPGDSQALVRKLLEENGGCYLPCWWGLTPGQSDWDTAKQFLETFVLEIEKRWEETIIKDGAPVIQAGYDGRYEIESGVESNFYILVENGVIEEIIFGGLGSQKNFRLHQLLADYGSPDEMYIKTYRYTNTGDPPPFSFILYYREKHFWADFKLEGEIAGDNIRACPQSSNPRIGLGSPAREWVLDDLFPYIFGPPVPNAPEYRPLTLKEATGLELSTFTSIFKDPINQNCLETSADLWH